MHACPICDTLWRLDAAPANSALHCPRCGHCLTTQRSGGFESALACSFAALVLLGVSATHPFLTFSASGQETSMTLLDSALSLFRYREDVLGGVVFTLVFLAPAMLLASQCALLVLLRRQQASLWSPRLARLVHTLKSWNMIEVFLVSVFVSAAKLASMAQLELGIAFFSFVGFTVCTLAAIYLLDDVQLWQRIELQAT
jgi:paraquat-inducible protein A